MKVLWSWLLEMCDLPSLPTVEEGARALTRGGLEIEGIENLGDKFTGVVVAEVVGKKPHPDAAKLTLVDVITEKGGTITQVVCGAPNVPEPGRRVLWAQVGATLPGGITLAPKPVKGIVSPGMLCAEDELGLGTDHGGIIVLDVDDRTPLGAPAQRALGLEDYVLDVAAPANRGDVLGHLGIARELCAMLRGRLITPSIDLTDHMAGTEGPRWELAIADYHASPRYTARVIDGVTVGPSPRKMAQRLRNVGVRSISNLVDITNYVMFELGQPLHAFDAATLQANVIAVSHAADGEIFVTLDNQSRTLVSTDLVIRDGDRGIALAGVMGGLDTEVTDKTTRVLLESAAFAAKTVRKTARRLGLRSEASLRFERGVDPELAGYASARAAKLLCEYAGGKVVGPMIDAYPGRKTIAPIPLRLPRVRMVSGVATLDGATCRDALERLGCTVTGSGETFAVTPLSDRPDLEREIDLIEEILRVTGYELVPSTLPALRIAPALQPLDRADAARKALAAAGLSEAITFGFQSVERCDSLGLVATDRRAQPIPLRNPMSLDQAVMRTSLLPNLVAAVARNQSFGRPDVAIFEAGSVFLRRDEGGGDGPVHGQADEPTWCAGVLAGHRPGHIGDGTAWDAFDAKSFAMIAIESIAGGHGGPPHQPRTIRATRDVTYLHPGVGGEILIENERVGVFGEVHPKMRAKLGVVGPLFAFELDLSKLHVAKPAQMTPIAKYPASSRDVSLLLAAGIPAGRITQVITDTNEPLIDRIRLLEDYRDAKLGDGVKSMLWSIGYRAPDRTLTDVEVDKAHEGIVARLVEHLPAQRR